MMQLEERMLIEIKAAEKKSRLWKKSPPRRIHLQHLLRMRWSGVLLRP